MMFVSVTELIRLSLGN